MNIASVRDSIASGVESVSGGVSSLASGVGSSMLGLVEEVAQEGLALDDSVIVPDRLWGDNMIARRLQGHSEREGDFLSLFYDLMFVGIGTQVVNSINTGVSRAMATGDFDEETHCFFVFFFLFSTLSCNWFDAQLFFAVLSIRSSGHILVFAVQVVSTFLVINSLGEAASVTSSFGIRWPYTLMGLGISRANAALTWWLVQREAQAARLTAHSLFLKWNVASKRPRALSSSSLCSSAFCCLCR